MKGYSAPLRKKEIGKKLSKLKGYQKEIEKAIKELNIFLLMQDYSNVL